jgi:hypothetical protein
MTHSIHFNPEDGDNMYPQNVGNKAPYLHGAKNHHKHSEFTSELYQPSDRCLSAKLVPTSADRGYHVVSVTDPYGSILGFQDRSHYYFFQVSPQLYS